MRSEQERLARSAVAGAVRGIRRGTQSHADALSYANFHAGYAWGRGLLSYPEAARLIHDAERVIARAREPMPRVYVADGFDR